MTENPELYRRPREMAALGISRIQWGLTVAVIVFILDLIKPLMNRVAALEALMASPPDDEPPPVRRDVL